ncbi:asparagine synthase C-terminal domain-containing protein [Salinibaculum rarum]|uniref:asparagine synthase C-terminal domain-containing protein n=1 Tax=Salinibaculum rarum TaxID=3058903 RepID=UPI00265FE9DF|nr:asparagine synthetase B [Salinibaculum sp. KK48]
MAGADPELVRTALAEGDPLPGTAGFAGELDGRLCRDVLGRELLYSERVDATVWSHDPADLDDPVPVPAGHVRDAIGDERVWTLPDPEPTTDRDRAVASVRAALDETLVEVSTDGLAIAFSGGVDSALLAARLDAPLYVVGFPDSHDVQAAREGARALGLDVRVVELDHDALERAIPPLVDAIGRTDAMAVQIALPLFLVARRVAADGFSTLAVGQGADELFGGYAKVARAPDDPRVEATTVRGARRELLGTLPDQLERDMLAIRGAGVEPVAPLLHDRVVRAALALPGALLVTDRGERKWTLRLAARAWLPDPVAFREKKAVQYGSLVSRELDRLARQNGFKRRMDDHVTRYVEALVD